LGRGGSNGLHSEQHVCCICTLVTELARDTSSTGASGGQGRGKGQETQDTPSGEEEKNLHRECTKRLKKKLKKPYNKGKKKRGWRGSVVAGGKRGKRIHA